jgi:hypothetical protein
MTTYDDPGSHRKVVCAAHLDKPILIVRKSTIQPDTMYLHEGLKAHDTPEFKKIMLNEIEKHINSNNCGSTLKSNLPKGIVILPAAWAIRHKRKIDSYEVYKWEIWLNNRGN